MLRDFRKLVKCRLPVDLTWESLRFAKNMVYAESDEPQYVIVSSMTPNDAMSNIGAIATIENVGIRVSDSLRADEWELDGMRTRILVSYVNTPYNK